MFSLEVSKLVISHLMQRFVTPEIKSPETEASPLIHVLPALVDICSAFPFLAEEAVEFLLGTYDWIDVHY